MAVSYPMMILGSLYGPLHELWRAPLSIIGFCVIAIGIKHAKSRGSLLSASFALMGLAVFFALIYSPLEVLFEDVHG